jgi:hypothetical protein
MEGNDNFPTGKGQRVGVVWQVCIQFSIPFPGMTVLTLWTMSPSVFASGTSNEKSIKFLQLPSVLRGVPSRQWQVDVDFIIRDFVMDASQDLLVLIQIVQWFVLISFLSILSRQMLIAATAPKPLRDASRQGSTSYH